MITENSVCSSTGAASAARGHCGHSNRGCGANTEGLFEFLYEFAQFENGHTLDEIDNFLL